MSVTASWTLIFGVALATFLYAMACYAVCAFLEGSKYDDDEPTKDDERLSRVAQAGATPRIRYRIADRGF